MKWRFVLSSKEVMSLPHKSLPCGATIHSRIIWPSFRFWDKASNLVAPPSISFFLCLNLRVLVIPRISAATGYRPSSLSCWVESKKDFSIPSLWSITVRPSSASIAGSSSASFRTLSVSCLSSVIIWGTGPLALNVHGSHPRLNSHSFFWLVEDTLAISLCSSKSKGRSFSLK